MANERPIVKASDPNNNFLNPDTDARYLRIALTKKVIEQNTKKKKNEFIGTIKYRVDGSRSYVVKTSDDLEHPSADPFRDTDVDKERIRSRGIVDRQTIEDRNVVYLFSEQLYHILYLEKNFEDKNSLATFLLRVPYSKNKTREFDNTPGTQIVFSFKDRENLRDPWLVKKPSGQKQAAKPDKKEKAVRLDSAFTTLSLQNSTNQESLSLSLSSQPKNIFGLTLADED